MPADADPGGWLRIAHLDGREVRFRDGSWRWVNIRAWARDRDGRLVFHADWHAEGTSWLEWYVADEEKMREP
jgi:hypothetical protein